MLPHDVVRVFDSRFRFFPLLAGALLVGSLSCGEHSTEPSDTNATVEMFVGKLSGRAALNAQLKELGYELTPDQLARAFVLVKHVLGKKRILEEMDLRQCAESAISPVSDEMIKASGLVEEEAD